MKPARCYVDGLCHRGWRLCGRLVESCHLIADSPDELHAMAFRLGLHRSWFQPRSTPHYDLTASRRLLAIHEGAIELDRRAFVQKLRELRAKR
jgi:hypothetical protein